MHIKFIKLALISLMLSLLSGCIFNFKNTTSQSSDLLDDAYPVLVVFDAEVLQQYSLNLTELTSFLNWQTHHYRPDLSFTIIPDQGQLKEHQSCSKQNFTSMHKAIEVLGDRYINCVLEAGKYRSFAYINPSKNSSLAVNVFNINLHPRLGYFNLFTDQANNKINNQILAGELFLWLNEQASFADLKTW